MQRMIICTNARGNEGMCAMCHAGYGMDDIRTYDFDNEENFSCVICHVGEGHQWAGSRYSMEAATDHAPVKPGMPRETTGCAGCHGDQPHPLSLDGFKLNDHTDRIACETCHIPTFAKGGVATNTG